MIFIGSDHAGFDLKTAICSYLTTNKIDYVDKGCYSADSVDYPIIAKQVCQNIREGDVGILVCGSGIGMSIACNRFRHIRGALCYDVESAVLSRKHNNANVLVLKGRNQQEENSLEIVKAFLAEGFEGGRHSRRLQLIDEF